MAAPSTMPENSLSEIQRRILVALEEAGEDDFAALVNTVTERVGAPGEIDALVGGLTGLIDLRMVQIARARDSTSRRWMSIPSNESRALLKSAKLSFLWISTERSWRWEPGRPRAQILLTASGQRAAHDILARGGLH